MFKIFTAKFWTFYGIIFMVYIYKSVDHKKMSFFYSNMEKIQAEFLFFVEKYASDKAK